MAGEPAHAATIGLLNGRSYSSFKDLASDLNSSGYKDRSARIEMLTSWNAAGSDDFDKILRIPRGCKATLYMHGHVFNRNRAFRAKSTGDGELICMESKSSLTIYGASTEAEKNTEYEHVMTYSSTADDGRADKDTTTHGATLTGGCSTDGGGCITVKANCTLTVNDVTIAGCASQDGTDANGYGGGILIDDDYSTVRLNNCLVTGCYGDEDGGGIYANDEPTTIELNNTIIERNYAVKAGGGMYTNDEKITIIGRNGSKIINNEAGTDGGGIYDWAGEMSVSGITIQGNKAKKRGGGIYCDDTGSSLNSLVITGNSAQRGGGVYINNDKNTINSCEITGNTASVSGGGVYVGSNVDTGFAVTGKTVIKENSGGNFYFSDNTPTDNRCNFSLIKGSEVHVHYWSTEDRNSIMVTNGKVNDTIKSPNCIQYLVSDDSLYHFTFNSSPNQRKIYYVRNGHDSPDTGEPYAGAGRTPQSVNPSNAINMPGATGSALKAGIVGQVGPGGQSGDQYNLIRGFTRHEETDEDTEDSAVAFYYSDAFFDSDPYAYNEHLATASLNMAYAGMYLRAKEETVNGNYYYNRHAAARQFMADIGCPDQAIYVNQSNEEKPGTDSIGVTIASKKLAKKDGTETGYILVPVTIRGGYELEWASNGTLGTPSDETKEAKGFGEAATQVVDEINKYIKQYGLEDELAQGKVKFWVSGYSRAGATANITSKRLIEAYADGTSGKNNQVFGYTCEAPMGGTDYDEKLSDKTKYYSIHNLINAVDLVPHVAPALMGFKRYGVDHYIPGTTVADYRTGIIVTSKNTQKKSGTNGSATTTYQDNNYTNVKGMNSNTWKSMLAQLRAVDSSIVMDEYFHPMTLSITSASMKEAGNYAGNNVEAFVADFVRFLMEGSYAKQPQWENNKGRQIIKDRDAYVKSLQPAIRESLALVFGMSSEDMSGFTERAMGIMNKLSIIGGDLSIYELYVNIIKNYDETSDADIQKYINKLWDKLEETDALEYLSKADRDKLKKNWPVLGDMVFRLLFNDYNYMPTNSAYGDSKGAGWAAGADTDERMMYVPTFATHASFILQNHYPEVNLAWARSMDNYYADEDGEYQTLYQTAAKDAGYKVNRPSAYGTELVPSEQGDTERQTQLTEGEFKDNTLYGNQKILFDVDNTVGEAVYYDLYVLGSDYHYKQTVSHKLYRGGIDLTTGWGQASYRIVASAISYGVHSDTATYDLQLRNDAHRTTIETLDSSGQKKTTVSMYRNNWKVTIQAEEPQGKVFDGWNVTLMDQDGNPVVGAPNLAQALLGDSKNKQVATFKMPVQNQATYDGTNKYPIGYGLKITATYRNGIDKVTVPATTTEGVPQNIRPLEGTALKTSTTLTFAAGDNTWASPESYPIAWTYTYGEGDAKKTVPAAGNARKSTVYTATIIVPQDITGTDSSKWVVFSDDPEGLNVQGDGFGDGDVTDMRIARNADDGSARIEIDFAPTGTSGGDIAPGDVLELSISAVDLNNPQGSAISTEIYGNVPQGEYLSLAAPDVKGMTFTEWNLDTENTRIDFYGGSTKNDKAVIVQMPSSPSSNKLAIRACYTPVISKIEAVVDAPVGGEPIGDAQELYVTIENTYKVSKDCYELSWSPETAVGEKAEPMTAYTATMSLKEGDIKATQVDPETKEPVEGASETTFTGVFAFSASVEAKVNGEAASADAGANTVSYTFPTTKYKLDTIYLLPDLKGIDHYQENMAEHIESLLADTTKIRVEGDQEFDANVLWKSVTQDAVPDDARKASTWTATGEVVLPDTVDNPDNVSTALTVKAHVNEADYALAPTASVPTGTYITDQVVTLATEEENGSIEYAIGEGNDFTAYDGKEIVISRDDPKAVVAEGTGHKIVILKAKTVVPGEVKWDSIINTYLYEFDDEIPIPKGESLVYNRAEQIGVAAAPQFYTVTDVDGDSGRVDADGDAVAKNAGAYIATLHIKDGFKWKLEDGTTTTEDQVVSFSIGKLSVERAYIRIMSRPEHAHDVEIKPDIEVLVDGAKLTADDYEAVYFNNVNAGTGRVKVQGKGNYTGESMAFSFAILSDIRHNVTIADGSTTTTRVYSEYEKVTIAAAPGEDAYFTNWKIKLLSSQGRTIKEDVAGDLLGASVTSATASFTMPENNLTHPTGYALEVTAVCADKVKAIEVSPERAGAESTGPVTPAAGAQLASYATLTFGNGESGTYPIAWSYAAGEGEDAATVPTSGEAFNKTAYTATIVVPQDAANGLVFAPTGKLSATTQMTVESIGATRNDADGSATVTIKFNKTADTGRQERPDANIELTVKVYDTAREGYDESATATYQVMQGSTVTLTAPEVKDKHFVTWKFDGSGIEPSAGSSLTDKTLGVAIPSNLTTDKLAIEAQYDSVASKVVTILDEPVSGQPMQMAAKEDTLKITISDEYQVDPEFVGIDWSPAPVDKDGKKVADYSTAYTATVSIKPKKDGENQDYIEVKGSKDSDYRKLSFTFDYSEALDAKIGYKGDIDAETDEDEYVWEAVAYDRTNNSLSYTFPMTRYNLAGVEWPEDIEGVAYGTDAAGIKALLPTTTKIETDTGDKLDAKITWGKPMRENTTSEDEANFSAIDEKYGSAVWVVRGDVTLPENVVNRAGIGLKGNIHVNVKAADVVVKPSVSVEPGEYLEDQTVTLSTSTQGAQIRYTTDSEITTDHEAWDVYGPGSAIAINRADAVDDELDEDGNPTGQKQITIRAVATHNNMKPSETSTFTYVFTDTNVPVPAGNALVYTGKPQIGVSAGVAYTLEPVSQGVTIDASGNAVATEAGAYQVKATLNDELYRWVLAAGATDEARRQSQTIEFTIAQPKVYTVTYELDGGTLDGNEGPVTAQYQEGTSIELPRPVKDGYTFAYWTDPQLNAGDTYTVTEDHVFTAVWKEGITYEVADEELVNHATEKDPAGATIAPLLLSSSKQTKKSVKLTWKKPAGTDRFVLYGSLCNKGKKKYSLTQIKTLARNRSTSRRLQARS